MTKEALILVLLAAVFHTGWNFLAKQVSEKAIFAWWALVAGSIFCIPLILAHLPIPPAIWPYALSSGAAEALYVLALAYAYTRGDFSLVYPIARGAAPAMLTVWAILFLGEELRPAGIAGLAILVCGLFVVGGAGMLKSRAALKLSAGAGGAALFMAFWTSVYSAIDGAAVRVMAPEAYIGVVFGLTALFLAPLLVGRFGVGLLFSELLRNRFRVLLAAGLMTAAYLSVLTAFRTANVCYVGALREISVVLAALAGWRLLGEELGIVRTMGAVLIFLGMLAISLGG